MAYWNTLQVYDEIYDPFGKIKPDEENADAKLVSPEIADWLVRLRLLYGVPFEYLVPRAEMLPPESVRFFYLDRNWTDRLVDGALSVGKTTTREFAHHHHLNDAILDRLDKEEHLYRQRLRGVELDRRIAGGIITGMLLRSAAVSSYPGLEIRAYSRQLRDADLQALFQNPPAKNIDQMKLLRMDRLSPNIMICLWLGIPKMVRIEEPREGIQFGVDVKYTQVSTGSNLNADEAFTESGDLKNNVRESITVNLRYVRDKSASDPTDNPGQEIPNKQISLDMRNSKRRVLNLENIRTLIRDEDTNDDIGNDITSAEVATQLLKFPYFQSFLTNPPANLDHLVVKQEDNTPLMPVLSIYDGASIPVISTIGTIDATQILWFMEESEDDS